MGSDWERRRQVMRDEVDRIEARERYANFRAQQDQDEAAQFQKRQQYVARHGGREGVIGITVAKWTIAAALLGVIVFFGELSEKGFLNAIGAAIGCFAAWTAIGVVRAFYLANSDG